MDANKILEDREKRALIVSNLVDKYQVVTLKANIPGLNKNIPISRILINIYHNKILEEFKPLSYSFNESSDGNYYLYYFDKKVVLKKDLEKLELESLGRFIDIDCFYNSTISLNRSTPRKCYLCEDIAFNCIRSKKHSIEELLSYMNKEVSTYLCNFIKEAMLESCLEELNLDTKFGLVSPISNGSHKDMDYSIMANSLNAIVPYLSEMFKVGYTSSNSLDEIFLEVKEIGIQAEKAMFKSTNNVNTYSGLIFNLGLVVTSLGYTLSHEEDFEAIFEHCSYMVRNQKATKGALIEAQNKYHSVDKIINNYSLDSIESKRYALIELIINVDDSIFEKRCSDKNERKNLKDLFKKALTTKDRELINQINETCEQQGYSFGGCADLLVVSLFLKKILKLF